MRIRYVGHACLQVRAAGLTVLSDPWWIGPAYAGQWHQFPPPAADGLSLEPLDYLYISHGHEDHCHPPTLATLSRGATVLIPELPGGDLRAFLTRDMGFRHVIELRDGVPTPLGNGLLATLYVNLTDSILVLRTPPEGGRPGRVLVDANDALHAAPPSVRRALCERIRRREGAVDYLFCGYGGESFWPNCVHYPGKDDLATARAREAQLLDAFVEAARLLGPRLLFPFAASVALLEPEKRWIDVLRLDGPAGSADGPIERFVLACTDAPASNPRRGRPGRGPATTSWDAGVPLANESDGVPRAHFLLPGDVVDGGLVRPTGRARPTGDSLLRACRGSLAREARELETPPSLSAQQADALFARLAAHVEARYAALPRPWRVPALVEIDIKEARGASWTSRDGTRASSWTLVCDGRSARLDRGPPRGAPHARVALRAEVLERAIGTPYGIDAITVGYGAEIWLRAASDLRLLRPVLHLLSCRPSAWRALAAALRSPRRALRFARSQRLPLLVLAATRARLLAPPVRIVEPARLDPADSRPAPSAGVVIGVGLDGAITPSSPFLSAAAAPGSCPESP